MQHLLLKDLPRYECLFEASKEFPELDPTAVEAFLHLLLTGDDVFAVSERNLSENGISHGRFGVLMLLWKGTQPREDKIPAAEDCYVRPRTPAELADAAGVTRATMTGLIDTLERDGLVKREPDPDDRRMMSVVLTAKGNKFLSEFLPGHYKVISALMAPLSESERKSLVRLLVKIQQHAATLNAARAAAVSTPA
jgi:DNA-binding MarR family transcriptional regulator